MKIAVGFILLANIALAACSKTDETTQTVPDVPPSVAEIAPAAPATPVTPAAALPTEIKAATPAAPTATPTPPAVSPAVPPAPIAVVPVAAIAKPDLVHGQQIYRQSCAFCHDKGVAGAPKLGDAAAWSTRMKQGVDTLYSTALRGKGAMPAKGGNPSLSETDIKAAVDYLLAQSS